MNLCMPLLYDSLWETKSNGPSLLQGGGKRHTSKQFKEILSTLTPGYLFMLGRSAASNNNYVRPIGVQKALEKKENLNMNTFVWPPRPSP